MVVRSEADLSWWSVRRTAHCPPIRLLPVDIHVFASPRLVGQLPGDKDTHRARPGVEEAVALGIGIAAADAEVQPVADQLELRQDVWAEGCQVELSVVGQDTQGVGLPYDAERCCRLKSHGSAVESHGRPAIREDQPRRYQPLSRDSRLETAADHELLLRGNTSFPSRATTAL